MNNTYFVISKYQLDDFKNHASQFSEALSSIDSTINLKGRKRTDCLAQACGYSNHSQLVVRSKGYVDKKPLSLFSPSGGGIIAAKLSEALDISFEYSLAAVIRSSMEIYSDSSSRWTEGDFKKYDFNLINLIYSEREMPVVVSVFEESELLCLEGFRKIKMAKTLKFPKSPTLKVIREMQGNSVLKAIRDMQGNPALKAIRDMQGNPALKAIRDMKKRFEM